MAILRSERLAAFFLLGAAMLGLGLAKPRSAVFSLPFAT